ncbi:MAG: tetratricopeptide repeat protein [Verrucomicrobiota bacterium]
MPDVALRHFELARSFAPNDRDIEQLQAAAALALARDVSDKSAHSGLDEAEPSRHEFGAMLRRTGSLAHIADARAELGATAGELGRQTAKLPERAPEPSFHARLQRALALAAQGEFADALAALEDAQQAGAPVPDLQGACAQVGLAAFDRGSMEVALAAFESVRDLGPGTVEGWFNCGLVYQKMGRLDDALSCHEEARRVAPDNPKIWCNLSSVWFERGDPAQAEKAARRCLALKPDYARAWDNLASALSAQNRLPEAAEACQQAIRIQPTLASAWFKFGVVNFQLENMVAAIEAFEMAAENPAFRAYVIYYLAMIAARSGEIEEAEERLAQAREADGANELESAAVKEVAAGYARAGDYARAADFYGQITKKDPGDFSAWLAVGTALHRAEKADVAREAYLRATQLRPDNPLPWHNLGLLASDQGRHEESRGYFQREVELAPGDAKAWYDLGVALKNLGRDNEAAEAFERAEDLVKSLARRSSDLSAALTIVRRLGLSGRMLKTEE